MCIKLLRYLLLFLFLFILFILFLIFEPGTLLVNVEPKKVAIPLPESLVPYQQNVKIKNFEKFQTKRGPESIAYHQGRMVVGSFNGYLYEIKINDRHRIKPLFKIISEEMLKKTNYTRFGHPKGIRFDSKGRLWVVEACFGVFKIENVFTPNPKIDLVFDIDETGRQLGSTSVFLDDVSVEEKPSGGYIISMTDVSTKYRLDEYRLTAMTSDVGRVIRYDTDTKKLDVIAENLMFPNGIETLHSHKGVIFSEFLGRTIWKYAPGKKAEKLLEYMPAETNNIRASPKGQTYWLAMFPPRDANKPITIDYLLRFPITRKCLVRFFYGIGSLLDFIDHIISNQVIHNLIEVFKTLEIMEIFVTEIKSGGLILEIDQDGKVISSIFQPNNPDYSSITEVKEIPSKNPSERILYLGSLHDSFIRKVTIEKIK